jgi:ABC-2 type transport system permease protein
MLETTSERVEAEPDDTSLGGAWRVVARKEFADHLLSARFTVLIAVLGVAAAASVYAASGGIQDVAPQVIGAPGLFLGLFTVTTDPVPFPFVTLVGFLGPLLGILFGFDAVSGERSQNTLPRLLSHPIHRDEVIIGKFVAGLGVIGLMLTALTVFVSGVGVFRLGISPTGAEVARIAIWLLFTIAYVGFWLAVAILASVTIRRAATAALSVMGVWLTLTLFGGLLFQAIGSVMGGDDALAAARAQVAVSRISPVTLFQEVTSLLLDPTQRAVGIVTYAQVDRAVVSTLNLVQSVLVVWPQMVAIIAMTCAAFAVAFAAFMRQEVRA